MHLEFFHHRLGSNRIERWERRTRRSAILRAATIAWKVDVFKLSLWGSKRLLKFGKRPDTFSLILLTLENYNIFTVFFGTSKQSSIILSNDNTSLHHVATFTLTIFKFRCVNLAGWRVHAVWTFRKPSDQFRSRGVGPTFRSGKQQVYKLYKYIYIYIHKQRYDLSPWSSSMATSHILSSSIGRGTHSVTSLEKIGQLRFFENATWNDWPKRKTREQKEPRWWSCSTRVGKQKRGDHLFWHFCPVWFRFGVDKSHWRKSMNFGFEDRLYKYAYHCLFVLSSFLPGTVLLPHVCCWEFDNSFCFAETFPLLFQHLRWISAVAGRKHLRSWHACG